MLKYSLAHIRSKSNTKHFAWGEEATFKPPPDGSNYKNCKFGHQRWHCWVSFNSCFFFICSSLQDCWRPRSSMCLPVHLREHNLQLLHTQGLWQRPAMVCNCFSYQTKCAEEDCTFSFSTWTRCATAVDEEGIVVDHAWGDCLDGCPGTSKGRVASPKRMNFWKFSDWPETTLPPHFWKIMLQFLIMISCSKSPV